MHPFLAMLNRRGQRKVATALGKMGREAIRIRTHRAKEKDFALGQSKIGGAAHVPPGFIWPEFKGTPQLFIAQINMAELPDCQARSQLPERGLLSFFFEGGMEAWGFDPANKGAARVYHFEDDPAKFVAMAREDKDEYNLTSPRSCRLDFSVETNIPLNSEQVDFEDFFPTGTRQEREVYYQTLDEYYFDPSNEKPAAPSAAAHKILGWPDLMQGDNFTEAQLVTNGLYCGDGTGYRDPRAKVLVTKRHDWQLLLQVDTDDNADMMWGDAGLVYFLIKKDDLATRSFDNIWFSFQCG